ncbi:multiple inositol polyphosphate phosphatase 1-like [Panonychus citri]|uniref:multiple inositol polyphosphate phosphatase 1-like n=1 Tax=Panonychus citri TaxID=50023 RepID=UPI002307D0FC|nr:multiple inositol polyphosphate phosphatase 1-like [Panonychus citri]
MDLKKGKVQKKKSLWLTKRFWLIVAVVFTLTMLSIALIFTLALPLSSLADKTCDNFASEGPYCLAQGKNDIKRVYSTRTTFNQSIKLLKSKSDSVKLPEKCEPVMLYIFSRHSIRYPKSDDIMEMGQLLPQLQQELTEAFNKGSSELCEQDYQAIKQWKLEMVPENDNHVTPSGVKATKKIAKLFYSQYPDLFDPNKVNFQVGVTSKVRTNETAHAFVEGLVDIKPEINIKESDYVVRDYLQFHSICKKKIGVKLPKPKQLKEITESKLFSKLRQRVSKRLGFNRTISDDELNIMYTSCSFEQAIFDKAPWCNVFTKRELKVLESREDIEHYYKNGPGFKLNRKMACPLIADLYESVERAINIPENRTTYLYFSHAGAMSRLWSTLDIFDKLSLNENFCPDGKREWQTSLILPFNVNFDVVLYRCSEDHETTDPSDYKLLTMINGVPIEIDQCDDPFCSATKFLKEYKSMARTCDLDELCKLPGRSSDGNNTEKSPVSDDD